MTDAPAPTSAPSTTVDVSPTERTRIAELARRSHTVIREHQASTGAFPASPTFSAYRGYSWYRDSAFIAEGVSRWGDVASANAFHSWACRVLEQRTELVASLVTARADGATPTPNELLPTRFTFDGADGTDPWWNFQTDGYGTWLWALATHVARHDLDPAPWRAGAAVAVDYLLGFWDLPCFDWWEEHVEQRHVSTLGAIYGGLRAAADGGLVDGERAARALAAAQQVREVILTEGLTSGRAPADDGAPTTAPGTSPSPTTAPGIPSPADAPPAAPREHLAKWIGSDAVDASLAACVVPFGVLEVGSPLAAATLDAISADLDVEGGVYRFRADVFYGGGRWPLLACLLGWNRAAHGDHEAALRHLRWAAAQADPTGELPEQVDGHLLAPEHRQEWLDRWGPVAKPLLWSHGMFLILADELGLLPQER